MHELLLVCTAATYDPHTDMYEFSFMSQPVKPKKVKKTAKPQDYDKDHSHSRALICSRNNDYTVGDSYRLSLI